MHLSLHKANINELFRFINNILMWTKSKNELKNFMNYLSTKNSSIKFDFNYFKVKIEFLDTLVYIEQRPETFRKTSRLTKLLMCEI